MKGTAKAVRWVARVIIPCEIAFMCFMILAAMVFSVAFPDGGAKALTVATIIVALTGWIISWWSSGGFRLFVNCSFFISGY